MTALDNILLRNEIEALLGELHYGNGGPEGWCAHTCPACVSPSVLEIVDRLVESNEALRVRVTNAEHLAAYVGAELKQAKDETAGLYHSKPPWVADCPCAPCTIARETR